MIVNGATRLFIIVGDPIAQVQAPAGMTQAFAAIGYNAVMVPIHISSADLVDLLKAVSRVLNLDGIIATIPHKFTCYKFCTSATERAHFLGAVNLMRRTKEGWHGEMLDGLGFVGAIRANGCEPKGLCALLAGAGGAGSAIAHALSDAGVRELAIHDADSRRRDDLIARLNSKVKTRVIAGSADPAGFDLIVNATPAGMKEDDPYPVEVTQLKPSMFVGCVITKPPVSPIVEAARKIGCKTSTGIDMFRASQPLMVDYLLGRTGDASCD
jgi:shikimate dehydrogenase